MGQLTLSSNLDPASHQARSNILRNLLLYREMTRREIGEAVSLSGGAVTKHTQWLIDRELVCVQKKKVPTSLRPVEELSLNGGRGTALTLCLDLDNVTAELVAYDGAVLHRWREPVSEPTQVGLMAAVAGAASRAGEAVPSIDAAGLSVVGYLSSEKGLIFDVEGIEGGWEPCQPGEMLPAFRDVPRVCVWTDVACKVRGLAGRLKTDERLVYLERVSRAFRLADIANGRLRLGCHGSTGSALHLQVTPSGPSCYCGRAGCFAAYLRHSEPVSNEVLSKALYKLIVRLKANHVGLEWQGEAPQLVEKLHEEGLAQVHAIADGQALQSEGLRALTLEVAFGSKIEMVAME